MPAWFKFACAWQKITPPARTPARPPRPPAPPARGLRVRATRRGGTAQLKGENPDFIKAQDVHQIFQKPLDGEAAPATDFFLAPEATGKEEGKDQQEKEQGQQKEDWDGWESKESRSTKLLMSCAAKLCQPVDRAPTDLCIPRESPAS
eukprot:SAG11_NODE_991_length_6262_cov_12.112607_6_plen_148_part_00